jgi:hypothetical protein
MKTVLSFISVLTAALFLELAAAAAEPDLTRYHVKVTDVGGQPVAGALVEFYRGPDTLTSADWEEQLAGRSTTDTNGTAVFTVTNHAVAMLMAGKPGLSLAWTMVWSGIPQMDPGDKPIVLALTPPMTVSGVVQDAAGKPLADAQVWVNFAFRPTKIGNGAGVWPVLNAAEGRRYLAARTSADGKFSIEKLPADATLELGASKPGLALVQPASPGFDPFNLSVRAGRSDIALTLKPAGSVEGMVVQAGTGAPLAGARVISGESAFGLGAQPSPPTGPDGRFRLADLSPGQHRLRAIVGTNSCPDWVCEPVTVEFEAGVTNRDVKITVNRGGVVEITVHNKNGDLPVARASIVLAQQASGESATTSDEGLARLRVVPGSYFLVISKLGLSAADCPAGQPVLALLIDAEQRPSRRALRLLGDQAAALKQKGVAVVVLQSGDMAEEAFAAWKQEAASPFPIARLKQEPEKARAAWGASELPWLILTDKSHRVIAEGFALDDLDAKLDELK